MARTQNTAKAGGAYLVNVGINYPPDDRRAEPGDTVTDLPEYAIPGLLAAGVITRKED